MQKRTREIIALVLLVVLGIAGISAAAWYILVGHNWNAAATSIDDRIGNMDGYTVVLCEGAAPTIERQQELSRNQPLLEQENFAVVEKADDQGGREPLALQDAIDSYLDKGSQVVIVICNDPAYYADPIIVPRNGKRIAVFSVDGPRADLAARNVEKQLAAYGVDFTICIVDSFDAIERGLGSVDIAVCSDFDVVGSEGRYIDGTYVLGAPYEGAVGAVIMAPSGFLSSKMIEVS